ncbi:MAG TPA: discoidin domain-containing protein [Jatrophihabitans sp.]|nr:discoidin domain-containing protein [Jatrophihabitans sp.]
MYGNSLLLRLTAFATVAVFGITPGAEAAALSTTSGPPGTASSGLACDSYTDVALGKAATASSSYQSRVPSNAVDGDNSTSWFSAVDQNPQWLQVDLGSSQSLCGVRFGWSNYATAFSVQLSDDATTWTTVWSGGAGGNGSQQLAVSGTGRYIRMYGTAKADASKGFGVREFDVYVMTNPQPPVFTSPTSTTFTQGVRGNFSITTRGVPAVTAITESGALPAGLRFSDAGDGTASIVGTSTAAVGDYPVTLTATNGVAPDASQTFTLHLIGAPRMLTVSTTADVTNSTGACGDKSITTPPTPLSLREATCIANNVGNANPVTITIPAGTYRLTHGELMPGKKKGQNITIAGAGSASTVLDGGHAGRVLNIDWPTVGGVSVTISGVTITNGRDGSFGGGAILDGSEYLSNPDLLQISDSVISNSQSDVDSPDSADQPGGGLYMLGGTLSLTNVTVTGNSSNSSPGAGVFYHAVGTAGPQLLTITGSSFSGNLTANIGAYGTSGGALGLASDNPSGISYLVSNTSFIGNTANSSGTGTAAGAAIFQENGNLTVTGSTFTGNVVAGSGTLANSAIYTAGTSTLHYNRLIGNAGAAVLTTRGGTVNATQNWWGCNSGPGTAGCDGAAGTGVTTNPWLVLTATANPAHVPGPNGTATITAALTSDSAGNPIAAGNLTGAFDGLPVSFADPPGDATVTSAPGTHTVPLSGGTASIDYHSNTTFGPDDDQVSLDNATVPATLEVDQPPAITSADQVTFAAGTPGSFTVTTAAGYPTATSITETGALPSGISFADNGDGTATLAGTPDTSGTYPLQFQAGNGISPDPTQSFTLTVGSPLSLAALHATPTRWSAAH